MMRDKSMNSPKRHKGDPNHHWLAVECPEVVYFVPHSVGKAWIAANVLSSEDREAVYKAMRDYGSSHREAHGA
jgi:hypothetical protein